MYTRKIGRLFIGAGLALAFGLPAQAQLEEIIVTARKTAENLQDSPAAITAFSEDVIQSIGVGSMRDYAQLVPNMFMIETQNSSFTFVNIRGITQMRNTDPSVAVVIDGVQQSNAIGMSQELYDIQQIEVLKGPQGALYGRNSIGGAINITTKRPTEEVEGFVRVGAGNGDSYKIQGAVSGPLIEDQLYGRVALSYSDSAGVRPNVATGDKSDSRDSFSIRGRTIWEASDTFEADLRASVSIDSGSALQFSDGTPAWGKFPGNPNVSLACGLGIFGPTSVQCLSGPIEFGETPFIQNPNNPAAGLFNADVNNTNKQVETSVNGIDERELYSLSALLTWDLEVGTLTSITSFEKATNAARGEPPPRTPTLAFLNTQWRDTKTWSQEIRLTSKEDQPLRWTVGAYYLDTNAYLSTTTQRNSRGIDSLDTFIKKDPLPRRCPGFPIPGSAADTPTDCVIGFDGDQQDNTAWAVFAQLSYDLTEALELTFSARYDEDNRQQTLGTPDAFLSFFCDITGDGDCSDPDDLQFGDVNSADFSSFQPKATLRWTPADNLMLYATYSEGFRSGGYNRPGIGNRADTNRGFFPPGFIPFGINDVYPQQDLTTFEAGFKWNSESGRVLLNAAAFSTKVDDYQSFTFNGQLNGSQIIIPIDEVEIHGIDVDAAASLTDSLSATLGFGWTDSEITEDAARGALNLGNKAPQTPETTLNIGLQYNQSVDFVDNGEVFLRADYQRIGELFFMPANWVARDALNLVNLRGGLAFGDGWRVEGWVRNATNENYFAEAFNDGGVLFFGKLRMYGLEVIKNF